MTDPRMVNSLLNAGIKYDDIAPLRRIAMTLHRWHELECGTETGSICRDETTGKPYWLDANSGRHYPAADRETGALKRLSAIMARYPDLAAYVQGDPRGAALYIGAGLTDSDYTRGVAVYK